MSKTATSTARFWKLALLFLGVVALGWLSTALFVPEPDAGGLLARGNAAYEKGEFQEAIAIWEGEGGEDTLLERRYNAGLAHLRKGDAETARERFEQVSARAHGTLRAEAFRNAAFCRFEEGRALAAAAENIEAPDARKEKLIDALRAYKASIDFYRRVDPQPDEVVHDLATVKTALRVVVDQIAQIDAEEKRRKEEELLQNPGQLLAALLAKEKTHRAFSRSLASAKRRDQRLGSRRLARAELETRQLTERFLASLVREPADDEPALPEDEAERRKEAATIIERVIENMKAAEIAYRRIAPGDATDDHGQAIRELRDARLRFPIDISTLVQEGIAAQESVLGPTRRLAARLEQAREETADAGTDADASSEPSALGNQVVEAVEDEVLQPIARLLGTSDQEESAWLESEEEDVVWVATILSQAEIPASPPPDATQGMPGQVPHPPGAGPPGQVQMTEEEAQQLTEKVQAEGQAALTAADGARQALAEGRADDAVPLEETALTALRKIEELLPKPPKPLEQRLAELIERQKAAAQANEGLGDVAEAEGKESETARTASTELATRQRDDGEEAGSIAGELTQRQAAPGGQGAHGGQGPAGASGDEKAAQALPLVQRGQEDVFTSAESIERLLTEEAAEPIERAIENFERALAILQGEQDDSGDQEQQQDDSQEQQQQDEGDENQQGENGEGEGEDQPPEKDPGHYELTPREARMLQEEMDRQRREEEKRVLVVPGGIAVDKDW